MKLSLVIPCFNEEESIGELSRSIAAALDPSGFEWEVLFIDDGSTDRTFTACTRIREEYPGKIKAYRFTRNYGKAAALSTGIAKATGEIIITMDADLQDDPQAIPSMVGKIQEGWDLVSGWKKTRHDPLSKKIPSKLWNTITSVLSGLKLHDFNCGFKAYRAETAKSIDIYGERHRYLPVLAHWDGFKVTEIPVPHHPRKYGSSKYHWFTRGVKGLFDLLTLLFLRKYLRNPLHFFGLVGVLLAMAGGCVLTFFGIEWIITRQMHIRPLVLLSVGAIIMGIQFVSIGLIGEMISNANPQREYGIRESLE